MGLGMMLVVRHDTLVLEWRRRIYAIDFMAREDNRPCAYPKQSVPNQTNKGIIIIKFKGEKKFTFSQSVCAPSIQSLSIYRGESRVPPGMPGLDSP